MNAELKNLIERIDFLKKEIDAMRPLPPDLEGKIMQKFRLDWNFHSNAIEGNSLTYGETVAFLMEGLTAKGKPLKDHLDLRGHGEAIEFLQIFIKNGEELTERDLRELHKMILVEPYSNPAQTPDGQIVQKKVNLGQYKSSANHVKTASGEMFYFASPEETPARMHDLMTWYRENRTAIHPLELAARFHYDFVRIHPFDDGNGRMSRLLMNFILMQFGHPPVVIKAQKKSEYFYALRQSDAGDKDAFVIHIGECLLHSLELYLKGANGESIDDDDDLDKELFLFAQSFEKGETTKKSVFDRDWHSHFAQDVVNIIDSFLKRSKSLNPVFSKIYVTIQVKKDYSQPHEDIYYDGKIYALKNLIYLPKENNLNWLSFTIHFAGFKKTFPPHDFSKTVVFSIKDHHFSMTFGKQKFELGYGIDIPTDQIIEFEKAFYKSLMEDIQRKLTPIT